MITTTTELSGRKNFVLSLNDGEDDRFFMMEKYEGGEYMFTILTEEKFLFRMILWNH